MTVTHKSFCRLCHAACAIEVDVHDRRVAEVRGDRLDPLFEGYTCIKGRQLPAQLDDPQRLRAALRRDPYGAMQAVPLAECLDDVAARIQRIIDEHGPRAVATYTGTGGFQNSLSVEITRAWHKAIGSPSFHTSVTIDQPAKAIAPARIGHWDAGYHSFRSSDVVMAIGYNPLVSSYSPMGGLQGTNPFVELRRAKARGMRLIVVDPRRTELAAAADLHVQIAPGEDPTFVAGVLHVILREGWHDGQFCETYVDGLADLMAAVEPFTPDHVAARCGIDVATLEAAAKMFAEGPRGTAGTGTGPNMSPHSSLAEHLAIALNVVCGRVNRAGDMINNPGVLVGKRPFRAQVIPPNPSVLQRGEPQRVRGLRGYRGEMLTSCLSDEILTEGPGQVKALIVLGGNPAVAWPDQAKTLRALAHLEVLVVLDHRVTATAELATHVIGARLGLERADVTHIMDRWFEAPYVNYTPAVVDRDGDVVSEWELIWELAHRHGTVVRLPGGSLPLDHRPDDDEVLDLLYANSRVPMAEIRANGGGRIYPELEVEVAPGDPAATARFDLVPPGIADELAAVLDERTSAEFLSGFRPDLHTFRLVSRRLKAVLNSLGPELPALAAKGTTNLAHMHPDDLAALGATDGDLLEISSPHGTICGVAAGADDVRRGVVSMAHSWGTTSLTDEKVREVGSPTNRLIDDADGFDPITGMPVLSAIPVAVQVLVSAR